MTILTPPKVLREKLGEDGVDALIEFLAKAKEMRKADDHIVPAVLREKLGNDGVAALIELVNIAKKH